MDFYLKKKIGERKLNMNAVLNADIDVAYYRKLKQGADVDNEAGQLIKNEAVTKPSNKPKSYAFCSDTAYNESIIPYYKRCYRIIS